MAGTNYEPTRFEAVLIKATSAELQDKNPITNISFLRTSITKLHLINKLIINN